MSNTIIALALSGFAAVILGCFLLHPGIGWISVGVLALGIAFEEYKRLNTP